MSYLINWTDTEGKDRSTPVFIYGTAQEHIEHFKYGKHQSEIKEINSIQTIDERREAN